jgi:thiol:disulfide interchange protein DsbD
MLLKKKLLLFLTAIIAYWGLIASLPVTGFARESLEEKLKEVEKQYKPTASLTLNTSADKVDISTLLSVNKVHPGAQFQAAVVLDIKENWHINAHIPTHEFLIGTKLDLDIPEGTEIVNIGYPEAERFRFRFAQDILDVYAGRVPILVNLKLREEFPQGFHTLKGILHVQACNDQSCLAPSIINITIPFEVVGFDQPITLNKSDLFSSIGGSNIPISAPTLNNEITRLFKSKGFLLAFLGIFVIGLALNLTPCVYPMLAVTVSLFSTQSHTKAGGAFFKALVYVLGIATMYTALGVTAALTGGIFGELLQNSWVLAGIALLFCALALSMFGLYELQPPYWLTSRLGRSQSVGIIGIYLSGLTVGIFAAPCIGPPIIALLALVSTKGDILFAFWVFFILSLGLGFPYLLLGTFSGMLNKLPRSGIWLDWVKKIFGIMLMGLALYYLALAIRPSLVHLVIPVTLIGGGLYITSMEWLRERGKTFMIRWKWVAGVIAIMLGTGAIFIGQQKGIQWELYYPDRLKLANMNGQPVVLDFYADWCIPCLKMDRSTFTDSRVITALKNHIKLKVDLTHPDSLEAETLVQQYKVLGVPTIIFLDRKGNEITSARIVGYLPPTEFLKKIELLETMGFKKLTGLSQIMPAGFNE